MVFDKTRTLQMCYCDKKQKVVGQTPITFCLFAATEKCSSYIYTALVGNFT